MVFAFFEPWEPLWNCASTAVPVAASISPAAKANALMFFLIAALSTRLSYDDVLPFNSVPHIAAGIPHTLIRLHIALFIRCTHFHRVIAWRLRCPLHFPGSE